MKFETLHDGNFLLFAAQHYENPHCIDTDEFLDDLNRFKYLKRLFNKYIDSGELRERLILNHIVILYNVFEYKAATRMLFWKLDGYEQILKPFLIKISYLPEKVYGIGADGKIINTVDISMDPFVISALRKI